MIQSLREKNGNHVDGGVRYGQIWNKIVNLIGPAVSP